MHDREPNFLFLCCSAVLVVQVEQSVTT
jgi:hypothetical protein